VGSVVFWSVWVRPTTVKTHLRPKFLIQPLIPLYIAWFFYMIRFYLMPWILGYSVMGMLSFPLESEFSAALANFIGKFVH